MDASHSPCPKIYCLNLLRRNLCCKQCLVEGVLLCLHALAWKKMSDRACRERIKLTTTGNHGIPDTFHFQTPKRAHFLQTGRKQMVHIFVYQWEVQVALDLPGKYHIFLMHIYLINNSIKFLRNVSSHLSTWWWLVWSCCTITCRLTNKRWTLELDFT